MSGLRTENEDHAHVTENVHDLETETETEGNTVGKFSATVFKLPIFQKKLELLNMFLLASEKLSFSLIIEIRSFSRYQFQVNVVFRSY